MTIQIDSKVFDADKDNEAIIKGDGQHSGLERATRRARPMYRER